MARRLQYGIVSINADDKGVEYMITVMIKRNGLWQNYNKYKTMDDANRMAGALKQLHYKVKVV